MSLTAQEQETAQWYEDHAADWVAEHCTPGFWQQELDTFCSELPPYAAILEIGPGSGQVAAELLKRCRVYSYIGVDVAPAMIKLAQESVPQMRFVLGSPYQLNLPDVTFDGWLAICSLGVHAPPERIGSALREVGRYLTPGANGFMVVKPGEKTERALDDKGRWFTYWNPPDLAHELMVAGYKVSCTALREGAGCGDRGWYCLWTTREGKAS